MIKDGDSNSYYLSRNRSQIGLPVVEASKENALEVEYREDDLTELQKLYIPDVSRCKSTALDLSPTE